MKSLFAKFWNQDNLFAPISMICGLAAWTILPFIGAMAAIFTGHIAYAKAKRLRVSGKGAALTGLIMGYSGLALATVLLGSAHDRNTKLNLANAYQIKNEAID